MVGVAAQFPSAAEGVVHHGTWQPTSVVAMHVFFCEVVYHFAWFGRCEKGGAGAVTKEAEVTVVCYDVNGRVEGYLAGCVTAGPDVVYGADIATVEAKAGADMEHVFVGWIGLGKREGVRYGGEFDEAEGWELVV